MILPYTREMPDRKLWRAGQVARRHRLSVKIAGKASAASFKEFITRRVVQLNRHFAALSFLYGDVAGAPRRVSEQSARA